MRKPPIERYKDIGISAPSEQPSPARSDKDAERKTVWWDRGAGGFYLSYESIPEKHRNQEGRIVKMVSEAERDPSSDTIDGPEYRALEAALVKAMFACEDDLSSETANAANDARKAMITFIDARRRYQHG